MKRKDDKKQGFTLIEVLIVIVILGVLATLISGNLLSSLKRGRDARRKANLASVAKALDLYYVDFDRFPEDDGAGSIVGCGVDGSELTCSWGTAFSATIGGQASIYMVELPAPDTEYYYRAPVGGASYQLYTNLEHADDPGIMTPYPPGTDCGGSECNYGIASTNTTP